MLGFAGFLRRYTDLFESVRDWRLIHVSEAPRGDLRARRVYHDWLQSREAELRNPIGIDEVLQFFRLHRAFERQVYREFTTELLHWYIDAKPRMKRVSGDLYASWLELGDAVVRDALSNPGSTRRFDNPGRFDAIVLPHSYPFPPAL